jgi:putative SOS response-associated peptidase YedK
MAWAALWESFQAPGGQITRTYCVVTVAANASLWSIHDRMPLVLEEADWPLWLGEVPGAKVDRLRHDVTLAIPLTPPPVPLIDFPAADRRAGTKRGSHGAI